MRFFLTAFLISAVSTVAYSQAISYVDPAQMFNRLLLEKSNQTYMQVGNFKVVGTPFLFGEKQKGSVYAKEGSQSNLTFSYNTFNQSLELYPENMKESLTKEGETIDSFFLSSLKSRDFTEDLQFINGQHLGATDKGFYQVVSKGQKYDLYKRYKSELAYVSTNYVQAELRQFDLTYDYYYFNKEKKQLVKLRSSFNGVKKDLKPLKDISSVVDMEQYSVHPEKTLKTIFTILNLK